MPLLGTFAAGSARGFGRFLSVGAFPAGNNQYAVRTFTSSTTWTAPAGVTSIDYLVVAGGGGGGANYGGGGGGGGFRIGSGFLS